MTAASPCSRLAVAAALEALEAGLEAGLEQP